jgi:hypothetical protein
MLNKNFVIESFLLSVKVLRVDDDTAIKKLSDFLEYCSPEFICLFINGFGETYKDKDCVINNPILSKKLSNRLGHYKEVLTTKKIKR